MHTYQRRIRKRKKQKKKRLIEVRKEAFKKKIQKEGKVSERLLYK